MSILHKSYKKIYPIIKEFENFCVREHSPDSQIVKIPSVGDPVKGVKDRLKHKLEEQETLIKTRVRIYILNLLGGRNNERRKSEP